MKLWIPILIFVIPNFLSGQFSSDFLIAAYEDDVNSSKYFAPVNDAFGSVLNTGVFPRYSDKGFHIKIGIHANRIEFTDAINTYQASIGQGSQKFFVDAPTVSGSIEGAQASNDQGETFNLPGGLGLVTYDMLAPELYVGTLFGTDFYGRYSNSSIFNKNDILIYYGGGVRHDFGRYFLPEYIKWYLSYNFNLLTFGDYISSTNQYGMTQLGVELNRIGVYGLFGYELSDMTFAYDGSEPIRSEAFNLSVNETTPLRYGGGLNLNFKYFELYGEYNLNDPVNIVVGFSVGI